MPGKAARRTCTSASANVPKRRVATPTAAASAATLVAAASAATLVTAVASVLLSVGWMMDNSARSTYQPTTGNVKALPREKL